MTKIFRKPIHALCLGTALMAAGVSGAMAQTDQRQFSAKSGPVVNQVLELAEGEQLQKALAKLQDLLKSPDLLPYERSTIHQMIGQYSYELDDSIASQNAFSDAIQAGGLLPKETLNLRSVIAQLKIGNGQYRDGAEALESYLKEGGEPKPQFTELLVNSWVQVEDYPRALPWAEKWFANADPKTRRHYDLMNFLYVQLGMEDQR